MNSELESTICNACGAEKTRQITLPSGHQGRQCPHCGLAWSSVIQNFEQLYNSAYDKDDKSFTWCHFLKAHENLKSCGHTRLNWFEKAFLDRNVQPRQGSLLEIGCSVGRFLLACKKTGWNVSGLDISERAVKLAREVITNGDIRCGTLDDEFWPAETFDVIACWEVIEHVKDPFYMLSAIKKLLKPGGQLVMSTPDWGSWAIRRHPAPNYWPPFHIWFFTENALGSMLKRAGLKVVSVWRKPIPWAETRWPRWKRIVALPWLVWLGIVLRQGGGRLVVIAKKV